MTVSLSRGRSTVFDRVCTVKHPACATFGSYPGPMRATPVRRSTWSIGRAIVFTEVVLVPDRGSARFDVHVSAGSRIVRVRGLTERDALAWEVRLALDAIEVLQATA